MNLNNRLHQAERILCIAHNTIRFVSAQQLYEAKWSMELDIKRASWMALNMQKRDLSDIIPNIQYSEVYSRSPKTVIYSMLKNLKLSQFIKGIYIFHEEKDDNCRKLQKESFSNIYGQMSVELLEKIIVQLNINGIILDDIELVKELFTRENISLDNLSFMVTDIAYNKDKSGSAMITKYLDFFADMREEWTFELADIAIVTENDIIEPNHDMAWG